MSNYTTVREPNILRDVTVSVYVPFYQINQFHVNWPISFFVIDKMPFPVWNSFAGRILPAGYSLETLVYSIVF